MSDLLEVDQRTTVGSRASRQLRNTGHIPAVLYGHGEEPLSLSVAAEQVRGVLRHGGKVVELKGAATGQALVQDTQWDTFGSYLLHVDLLRVDASEVVTVEVAVELKGDAAGANEGGVVEQTLLTVEVEAPATEIPEKLVLDVTELHLNGSLAVSDLKQLPPGVKAVTDADAMIVHCVPPAGEVEETSAAPAGEPEVLGAKSDEDGGDS